MTKRIDEIIARAYENLDRFYKNHGEKVISNIKPRQRKQIFGDRQLFGDTTSEEIKILTELKKKTPPAYCKHPGCTTPAKEGNQFCSLHMKPKIISPKPKLSLNIKGLSSREIVALIKKETGVNITVSLKSKQNIIRHAKMILKEKGMKLYG